MNIICRNFAPSGWYLDELEPDEWAWLKASDLLFLHNLLDGVERRLVRVIGAEAWEREFHDFRGVRILARAEGELTTAVNYEKLRQIVVELEAKEIAELTGRAA